MPGDRHPPIPYPSNTINADRKNRAAMTDEPTAEPTAASTSDPMPDPTPEEAGPGPDPAPTTGPPPPPETPTVESEPAPRRRPSRATVLTAGAALVIGLLIGVAGAEVLGGGRGGPNRDRFGGHDSRPSGEFGRQLETNERSGR